MPTLEEAVVAFESWRAKRGSRKAPIPERLWVMVKNLVPYYKKNQIQKALRLSGGQFNKRCMACDEQKPVASTKDRFAIGIVSTETLNASNEACELTLRGMHKSLQIKIGIQHLSSVLSLVEGYL